MRATVLDAQGRQPRALLSASVLPRRGRGLASFSPRSRAVPATEASKRTPLSLVRLNGGIHPARAALVTEGVSHSRHVARTPKEIDLTHGAPVSLRIDPNRLHIFDPASGVAIREPD